METGTDSFAVYFLAGFLPWTAFSEALSNATEIFLGRVNLITKVAFPLELLPLTGIIVPFSLNGLGFVMYLVYLIFKGYFHFAWFWLPIVVVAHMVFSLGLVILISSLSVFLRDIKQFIGGGPFIVVLFDTYYLSPEHGAGEIALDNQAQSHVSVY